MIMWSFGTLELFVKPTLAEQITSKFHEGIMQGVDEPQGISNMLWALAYLGYAPPAPMLDHFKVIPLHQRVTYVQSMCAGVSVCLCLCVWACVCL